jgi:ketosteroid isomerase-like protein
MSRENVEVVRRNFEAWQRDDLDGWLSYQVTDIEWHVALRAVDGAASVYRGHEGTRAMWERFRTEVERFRVELQEIREVDEDRVVLLGHGRFRGPASGIEVGAPLGQVYTLRDGKIIRSVDYNTHEEALGAVGLRE